ncbi:hypothetical protein EZY14_009165 [Kordia sp. TARA_039_SRF]|nr:hypothetical protein EZY14_009165 [Kordia sp. TARA_039_SRF]
MMNSIESFNSLHNKTVTRERLVEIKNLAFDEQELKLFDKIRSILKEHPTSEEFKLQINHKLISEKKQPAKPKKKSSSKKDKPIRKMGAPSIETKNLIPAKLKDLEKKGFVSASSNPKIETFTLPGEIGKFLQKIQKYKELILIKGTKHTSKSQIAMQIANAFGEKQMLVGYIDQEQGGLLSKDTLNSRDRNTSEKGRQFILIKGDIENPMQEIEENCKHFDVIVADSVTDLGISADELNYLRTKYPNVIWVFISQVKENGNMYGGNKMAHNPTKIINCHPNIDYKKRYATLEKNRGNNLDVCYNIFEKKIIDCNNKENESTN